MHCHVKPGHHVKLNIAHCMVGIQDTSVMMFIKMFILQKFPVLMATDTRLFLTLEISKFGYEAEGVNISHRGK